MQNQDNLQNIYSEFHFNWTNLRELRNQEERISTLLVLIKCLKNVFTKRLLYHKRNDCSETSMLNTRAVEKRFVIEHGIFYNMK